MSPSAPESYPFPTLPNYLAKGLRLVFVGINPAIYAVRKGHYFARPGNRFWPALSRSRLSEPVRRALGLEALNFSCDSRLLDFGIGFTDVVKVASVDAASLTPADYEHWVPSLLADLERYQPRVACFQGKEGYSRFARIGLGLQEKKFAWGPQPVTVGGTRVFLTPSTSGLVSAYRLDDYAHWFDRLADFLDELEGEPLPG